MSQYINFFIAHKGEKPIPLVDYPRSNILYSHMDAPYGKMREYSEKELEYLASELLGEIKELKDRVKYLKEDYIGAIIQFNNNSINDKLDAIDHVNREIEEIEGDIDSNKKAYDLLLMLADTTYNDNKVFAGIEVGDCEDSPS